MLRNLIDSASALGRVTVLGTENARIVLPRVRIAKGEVWSLPPNLTIQLKAVYFVRVISWRSLKNGPRTHTKKTNLQSSQSKGWEASKVAPHPFRLPDSLLDFHDATCENFRYS